MADTIARLIFEANTAQLKKANDELKKLAKESGTVTKSIDEGTAATKKSTRAKKAQTEEQKKATAIRKAEIKAYAEQARVMKRAEINANRENLKRKAATQKMKENSEAAKKLAAAKAKEKEATKIKLAVQKAEINAYREEATRKQKAIQSTNQNKNAVKKNSDEVKKANAIKRAEIRAYQEAAKMKEKAASASSRLRKKQEQLTNTNEKLAKSFRNASTATAALQGPLNGLSGRLSFIATGLGRIGVQGLTLSAGFVGLAFAVRNSLKVFQEYELQMLKVEALVKSTGGTAGFTSKQLDEMAVGLATATMASANEMRNAQGILLTFKAISGDVFESALGLTVDIGAAMGQTASSGAKQLGKALEDPARNMTGLTRAGISFTEQEKKRITALQKSGDLQGAQAIIIKTLTDQLGGAGVGGGLAGAADLVSDNFERLNIGIAKEFGLADLATKATLGLANALGTLADKIIETPEEELARLLGTDVETSKTTGGRSRNVNFDKPNRKASSQLNGRTRNKGGRSKDVDFDPVQTRIKELQEIIAKEEKAQEKAAAAAKKNQDRIKEEARIEREILSENMRLKRMELQEHNLRIQGFEEDANLVKFERLMLKNDLELEAARKQHGDLEELERIHQANKNNIITEQNLAEMEIANKRHKLKKEGDKQALQDTKKFLSHMGEQSKKAFKVKKMIDIADAIVSGHKAATDAHAAGMSTGGPAAPLVAKAYMAASIAATGAKIAAIKSTTFSGGSSGGGSVGGAAAAQSAPIQEAANDEVTQAPQAINVTVDGSIDPTGARRIIEAINEATEDGLEINALVGS